MREERRKDGCIGLRSSKRAATCFYWFSKMSSTNVAALSHSGEKVNRMNLNSKETSLKSSKRLNEAPQGPVVFLMLHVRNTRSCIFPSNNMWTPMIMFPYHSDIYAKFTFISARMQRHSRREGCLRRVCTSTATTAFPLFPPFPCTVQVQNKERNRDKINTHIMPPGKIHNLSHPCAKVPLQK